MNEMKKRLKDIAHNNINGITCNFPYFKYENMELRIMLGKLLSQDKTKS